MGLRKAPNPFLIHKAVLPSLSIYPLSFSTMPEASAVTITDPSLHKLRWSAVTIPGRNNCIRPQFVLPCCGVALNEGARRNCEECRWHVTVARPGVCRHRGLFEAFVVIWGNILGGPPGHISRPNAKNGCAGRQRWLALLVVAAQNQLMGGPFHRWQEP